MSTAGEGPCGLFEIPEIVSIVTQYLDGTSRSRCIAINNVFFNEVRRLRYTTVSEHAFSRIRQKVPQTRVGQYLSVVRHLTLDHDHIFDLDPLVLPLCETLALRNFTNSGVYIRWETHGPPWPRLRTVELYSVFLPLWFVATLSERFESAEFTLRVREPRTVGLSTFNRKQREIAGFFSSIAILRLPQPTVYVHDAQDPAVCLNIFKTIGLRDHIRHLDMTFTEPEGELMDVILTRFHEYAPYHDIKSFTCLRGIEHAERLVKNLVNVRTLVLHIKKEAIFHTICDTLTKLVTFTATVEFEPATADVNILRDRNPGLVTLQLEQS